MVYSDFTLQEAVQRLQLVPEEQHNLFAAVPEVVPGDFLCASIGKSNGLFHRLRAPTLHHRVPPPVAPAPARPPGRPPAANCPPRAPRRAAKAQAAHGARRKACSRNAKGKHGRQVGEGPGMRRIYE